MELESPTITIEQLLSENRKQKDLIIELTAQVQWLREQFNLLRAQRFGASSEVTPPGQEVLIFNEAEALASTEEQEAPDPETEEITYKRKKAQGHRDEQLKELPVEVVPITLPESEQVCPCCGGALHELRVEIHRELKIEPAKFSVVSKEQQVYSCRTCEEGLEGSPIVTAPMPAQAFPKSLASPSAVAYIMDQKFTMALPLYRQEQNFERLGIGISRQTMANWMIAGAKWLETIYERLHGELITRKYLHADESTLQVLHEEGRAAKQKSYMWLYRSGNDGPPIALYDYQATRAAEHPEQFLKGFCGYLHADAYGAYVTLAKSKKLVDAFVQGATCPTADGRIAPSGITIAGCMAHGRRGFTDALKALPPNAKRSGNTTSDICLAYFKSLYKIEAELKDATAEQRLKGRQETSAPICEKFHSYLLTQSSKVAPKTKAGEAIAYMLNHWETLTVFLTDGNVDIDNNRAERSIKPYAIGRKNWLFANTPKGARSSAVIYSIIETAKENNLIPTAYLEHLFTQLPLIDRTDPDAVGKLLPWSDDLPQRCRMPVKAGPVQTGEQTPTAAAEPEIPDDTG